ncbi:MAG: type II toxin-antitoxin system VapC family toxin [Bacillota bacterium]
MISAVDTNVLLDILVPNAPDSEASKALIDQAYSEGSLVICEVVYAELFCQFETPRDMNMFLSDTGIRLVPSGPEALQKAALAWKNYVSRRTGQLQCARCGKFQGITCIQCGATIAPRQHIVTDFIIGGHALTCADRLLSRDRGFYKTYFPSLKVKAQAGPD